MDLRRGLGGQRLPDDLHVVALDFVDLETAVDDMQEHRLAGYQVEHYRIKDSYHPASGKLSGVTRFTAVSVRQDARTIGTSNYTMRKLLTHALNMVTGFSTLPLQMASWIGFVFTIFGMIILVYVVGRYALYGSSVAGLPNRSARSALFR